MGDGSLAFESEHLRFERQLKRFMTYRPTARAVFYRGGSILLGIHKENGVFTLPGGRFDQAKDLIPGLTLVECLYNETLHREVKEELGIQPYNLSESRNSHIGYTLWRHPDTNTPCFEVIYAIQWDPTPSVPISLSLIHI